MPLPAQMQLCLVGMSGAGKSFWAKRLEALGAARHDCDGDIAVELASIIAPEPDEDPVRALGRWMGMPWSEGYAARAARYLALEEKATREALARVTASPGAHVIDTTGSVIYLPHLLLVQLRAAFRVVYLRTPEAGRAAMLRRYTEHPKPVIWGHAYAARPGEPPETALPRCYEQLLRDRDRRYLTLSHVVIDAAELEAKDPGIERFLVRCGV